MSAKAPTVTPASSVTVRNAELPPSVAVSPAVCGTFGLLLQFVPADQLPSTLLVQIACTPGAVTTSVKLLLVVVMADPAPLTKPAPVITGGLELNEPVMPPAAVSSG